MTSDTITDADETRTYAFIQDVHTIPDCFSFRHKKKSGKALAQNWNKSLNASKIMPEQLTERVLVN